MDLDTLITELEEANKILDKYTGEKAIELFFNKSEKELFQIQRAINTLSHSISLININFSNAREIELREKK